MLSSLKNKQTNKRKQKWVQTMLVVRLRVRHPPWKFTSILLYDNSFLQWFLVKAADN